MPELPEKLANTLETLGMITDRGERIQLLIDIADRFREVSPGIARRPFAEGNRVPARGSGGVRGGRAAPGGYAGFPLRGRESAGDPRKGSGGVVRRRPFRRAAGAVAAVPQDVVYQVFGR